MAGAVLGTLYWLFPLILGNTLKQVAIFILQTRKWNLREVKQLSNFIQRRSEQAGFELGSLCPQAQQCSGVCPLSVGVQRGWRERHACGCSCHVTTLEGPARTILLLKEDRKQVRDEGTDGHEKGRYNCETGERVENCGLLTFSAGSASHPLSSAMCSLMD